MARILSIDYGKKRTGLAVTDSLQLIDYLKDYIAKEPVERIVIGRPTQPDGRPSENLARVEQFVNRWRKLVPNIPIEYYDERFTSVIAHQVVIDSGVRKKVRKENKGLIDEISATIILQDYMQYRHSMLNRK